MRRLALALTLTCGTAFAQEKGGTEYFPAFIGTRTPFAEGRLDVSAEAKAVLDRQIAWLMEHQDFAIILEGHTDEKGGREYNLALGERRAVAVKNYMVGKGLLHSRIATRSFGEERPAISGDGAANRRVETRLEPLK